MVSEEDIAELKTLAAQSCISIQLSEGVVKSLGRMLGSATNNGKAFRVSIKQKVRDVVEAVFADDPAALTAAKETLFQEIKRVHVIRFGEPLYRDDDQIQRLTDQIALNVTRFTKHLDTMRKASEAEAVAPATVIDSATATEERRSNLFTPAHPRIPTMEWLRRQSR